MAKKLKTDGPTRFVFDAQPDLALAIDLMRSRYGLTRKAFVDGVMRAVLKLEHPVNVWVDRQVAANKGKGAA